VPDVSPQVPSAFFLDLDSGCLSEEPSQQGGQPTLFDPRNGLPWDDCWLWSLSALGPGAWGWEVPLTATGSDGTTPVVFDHWNVTDAGPMPARVFADQTTDGTPGYCQTGERGIRNGRAGYESWWNVSAGVGIDASYQAVYTPADPDTTPPQITINLYFDCETFEQNSTSGSKDGVVGGTYDFSCTDPGDGVLTGPSGIKSCTGKLDGTTTVQDGDLVDTSTVGTHTLVVTAVDNQNNQHTRTVTYHVVQSDATPPTLNPSFSTAPPFVQGQTGVTLSPNASDDSGIASSSCDAIVTSTVGNHSAHCTATDNVGNTAGTDVTYFVKYGTGSGFLSPPKKSTWKRGQAVPIKLMLTTAQGTPISDIEAAALAKDCKVVVSATGAQTITAPGCMKYDATKHQFAYTWNLPKTGGTGTANITATISYPSGGPTTIGPLPINIT
jgi:hypothetical protein